MKKAKRILVRGVILAWCVGFTLAAIVMIRKYVFPPPRAAFYGECQSVEDLFLYGDHRWMWPSRYVDNLSNIFCADTLLNTILVIDADTDLARAGAVVRSFGHDVRLRNSVTVDLHVESNTCYIFNAGGVMVSCGLKPGAADHIKAEVIGPTVRSPVADLLEPLSIPTPEQAQRLEAALNALRTRVSPEADRD